MTSFGEKIANEDKRYIIDNKLSKQRDNTILDFMKNIKEREPSNEDLKEVLAEYKEYIKSSILEKEMQILALNNLLLHLDNIKQSGTDRRQYQIDEDAREEKKINVEKDEINKELEKLRDIVSK